MHNRRTQMSMLRVGFKPMTIQVLYRAATVIGDTCIREQMNLSRATNLELSELFTVFKCAHTVLVRVHKSLYSVRSIQFL
jgi:hypothetical protein